MNLLLSRSCSRMRWDRSQDWHELQSSRSRTRPGQRRTRPAGGLLHRFAGHAADPGHRLRSALRIRHLPPGDPDGYQVEQPDNWLRRPDPWEIARPTETVEVPLNCRFELKAA